MLLVKPCAELAQRRYIERNRTPAQLGCSPSAGKRQKKRLVRVLATALAAARLLHDGSLVPASADTVWRVPVKSPVD
ncbi:hypothetical protein EOA32_07310 [Mesorhizobium sp. M1A.F.Ca.ET.072.01.1.1]|uniref:hypothetical protein n=1 Tax=Mesorhizobium sp. M1A.F.Ca.ET.072.01.1.1 TaxID=2496753 RepID=UPI000FD2B6BE|nr:hypothetical protein [Mesorhizobium sp. M1A.F.Ca.ET.072.01.1.1]RUW53987.1 hypothetical protein EOA32_07310 [Mesorhizobium sp. M1A.F.Ca.ET.072.01.1.1]TIV04279.1 MAG: hypothetical protein E5W04_04380 [Mesorhizobium sp.]